ncbi:hypothetical protein ACVBIL_16545 [Shewanella sp. 125m-7]
MTKQRLLLLTTASLLISSGAHASVETQLTQCAAIQDKLERLICYDKLSSSLNSHPAKTAQLPVTETLAVAASTTAVVSTANKTSHDDFGQVKKADKEEISKIYLEVAKVSKDAYGALKISFANNQIWKQTDNRTFRIKPGQKVFIEKAAFGSFMLGTDDRNTTIRVKRLK